MGYGRALLMRDVKAEEEVFQKKARKKGLWGSIGRTIGSLGAMAITGGMVNPLTVGLISGGASFLGGAAGAKLSKTGALSKGRFFKSDREKVQEELGAFGTQNITASLKSGVQAGLGQAAKLYKAGSRAQEAGKSAAEVSKIRKGVGFKEGFGDSFVGKHGGTDLLHKFKQGKADLLYGGDRTAASREISKGLKGYEFGTGVKETTGFTEMDRLDINKSKGFTVGDYDLANIKKVDVGSDMKPMWNKQRLKSIFADYFAPGKQQTNAYLYERYPEMFEGASSVPKQYTSGASTVIGGK